MDSVQALLASNVQLCALETELAKERNELIKNHSQIHSSTSAFFSCWALFEKYTGFVDEYTTEISKFKKLVGDSLKRAKTKNVNSSNVNVNNNNSLQTTSNLEIVHHLPTNISSEAASPRPDNTYLEDDTQDMSLLTNHEMPSMNGNGNNNNANIRKIAQNVVINNDNGSHAKYNINHNYPMQMPMPMPMPMQIPIQMPMQSMFERERERERELEIMESQVKTQQMPPIEEDNVGRNTIVTVQRPPYRYEGRGFEVLKRNYYQPIYATTTLWVYKVFPEDPEKVKRFLIKRGGFSKNCFVGDLAPPRTDYRYDQQYMVLRVRWPLKNTQKCVHKLNSENKGKGKLKSNAGIDTDEKQIMEKNHDLVKIQENRSFGKKGQRPNCKLYVNNFDILDKRCHANMTQIFLKFGELEEDIFMNKDKNGNPYAFVQYRHLFDAKKCWNSHNRDKPRILFGDRFLNIDYFGGDRQGGFNQRGRGRGRGRPRGRGRSRGRR